MYKKIRITYYFFSLVGRYRVLYKKFQKSGNLISFCYQGFIKILAIIQRNDKVVLSINLTKACRQVRNNLGLVTMNFKIGNSISGFQINISLKLEFGNLSRSCTNGLDFRVFIENIRLTGERPCVRLRRHIMNCAIINHVLYLLLRLAQTSQCSSIYIAL